MYRLAVILAAAASIAGAVEPIPVALWAQVAMVPPGTNDTRRTDIVPGGAVVGGGVPATGGVAGSGPGAAAGGGFAAPGSMGPGGVGLISSPGAGGGSAATASSTGAAAPAASVPEVCTVRLISRHLLVDAAGGPVEITLAPMPAHCKPTLAASSQWLQLAADGVGAGVFRFSAAPNTAARPRTATVIVGDQVFTVEQAALITTRLAAAPGRIIVGLSPKRPPTERRQIALWADKESSVLAVSPTARWIRVEPVKTRKTGGRLYDVLVDIASLPAGSRHEGAIIVTSDGAPPLAIVVVVEAISSR